MDREGHDACQFAHTVDGWIIEGAAVFENDGQAANLSYRLVCDQKWTSMRATVAGWIGEGDFRLDIERDGDNGWCTDGKKSKFLYGLKDIDLGFTPASNTNAI